MFGFDMMMDLILLGSGVYCLYTWIKLLVTKHLFQNGLLVPKDKRVEDCSDEQAYIHYMMPPLAVVALVTMAYGIVFTLNDCASERFVPYPWALLLLVPVLGALIWYAVRNVKANREYFGM